MGRRRDLNGYVDRLLDGLAGRVAAQLSADHEPPPVDTEPVGAPTADAPPPVEAPSVEAEPEAVPEPEPAPLPPREPVLTREEQAALAVLADPRVASDLRRADLEPDRFARPYEEISRALGLG